MKTIKITIIFSLFIIKTFSQTNFQGGIYTDTTLTKENSPYIITDNVVVFGGKTLTINPGVVIEFAGNYKIEIRGNLNAIGTEKDSIVFTSNKSNPQKNDWYGLKLTTNATQKVSIKYCIFQFAETSIFLNSGGYEGTIEIQNSLFRHNHNAISGWTFGEILVNSCTFTNNDYCIDGGQVKKVRNSIFSNNTNAITTQNMLYVYNSCFKGNDVAINPGSSCLGEIKNCKIDSNGVGIIFVYKGLKIENNQIEYNLKGIKINGVANDSAKIRYNSICYNEINAENLDITDKDLSGNCWCTSNKDSIEKRLIDGYDNLSLGLFFFDTNTENCGVTNNKIINQVSKAEIVDVYPNPFMSILNIDSKSTLFNQILIYNIFGQIIYKKDNFIQNTYLQLENLNSGMYYLVLKSDSEIITKKIVKK